MKRTVIGGGIILLGAVSVLAYQYIRTQTAPSFVPKNSRLELHPPARAISATLVEAQGETLQFLRQADDFTPATPSGAILQGETIATKKGSAVITLQNLGVVSLAGDSEVGFTSLVPDAIMLRQKSGSVSYEVNSLAPFSIRALHALVTLNGDATITMADGTISLRITKGTAKLAIVDTQNNTQVWDLVQGHRATIDDEARSVVLRK